MGVGEWAGMKMGGESGQTGRGSRGEGRVLWDKVGKSMCEGMRARGEE